MYERPLFFDYNATAATATAHFVTWYQSPSGHMVSPRNVQFLQDGQHVRRCASCH